MKVPFTSAQLRVMASKQRQQIYGLMYGFGMKVNNINIYSRYDKKVLGKTGEIRHFDNKVIVSTNNTNVVLFNPRIYLENTSKFDYPLGISDPTYHGDYELLCDPPCAYEAIWMNLQEISQFIKQHGIVTSKDNISDVGYFTFHDEIIGKNEI
jgi:hypothetical protein